MFRREFLKKSITGPVGLVVGGKSLLNDSYEGVNNEITPDIIGSESRGDEASMILITKKIVKDQLALPCGVTWIDSAWLAKEWTRVKSRLNKGESLFFLGTENIDFLQELWVFATPGDWTKDAKVLPNPAGLAPAPFAAGGGKYLYVRPKDTYTMHGVDDEPRMDILPLIASVGEYGNTRGYPGILCKHKKPSLTGGNYRGANWFIFAVDDPLAVLPANGWNDFLRAAATYTKRPLYLSDFKTQYPLYTEPCELVEISYRVSNRPGDMQTYTTLIEILDESGKQVLKPILQNGALGTADCEWKEYGWHPDASLHGTFTVRVTLRLHDRYTYGERREQTFDVIDMMEIGVMLHTKPIHFPKAEVKGADFLIDGQADFFIGTHLYPSSIFYEYSYRPVRVHELMRGAAAMRLAGIRYCRIWSDPVVDETSIRGMEAVIRTLAEYGIVTSFVIFSSWVHEMAVHTGECDIRFEVATLKNERLIGLYIQNMKEQKILVSTLAKRWKNIDCIVWDFTNEFSVVDPAEDQLDVDWLDPVYKTLPKPYDNINLFEQWALQIKGAIRSAGAEQPVLFGVSCWDTGSENYRCNKLGDMVPNHGYYPLDQVPAYLYLSNSACIGKPQFMEEFGGVWPDNTVRAGEYDSRYHYYLGAGESAAVNYEWGVLWLCDVLPGTPPYLKMQAHREPEELDDFLFAGRYHYGRSWAPGGTGVCPWAASFEYACIYNCVDSPSPTMAVMRRATDLGKGMKRVIRDKETYLVLPFETNKFKPLYGYSRKKDVISALVRELNAAGVDFGVWQDDEMDNLPASAKFIFFPNENALKPEAKAVLDRLKVAGAVVYLGDDESWRENASIPRVKFETDGELKCFVRDIPDGVMILPVTDRDELQTTRIRYGVTDLTLGVLRAGAVVTGQKGVIRAEFTGELSFGSERFAFVEENAGAPGNVENGDNGFVPAAKVLLCSNDGATLQNSVDLSVYAHDACKFTVKGVFRSAEITDVTGVVLKRFIPETADGKTILALNEDDRFTSIRLMK